MNTNPVRISNEALEFLKKFQTNRIRIGTDEIKISYINALNLIVKYFKNNNSEYVKLVQMVVDKNGS